MSQLKIGDKVKVLENDYTGHDCAPLDRELIVSSLYSSTYSWNNCRGRLWGLRDGNGAVYAYEWNIVKLTDNKMSIKESFALAFKNEPEKSFRKTGITNGDDFLTEDGQAVFLSFLLKKYGAEFKTEVVDGLLADMEKKQA